MFFGQLQHKQRKYTDKNLFLVIIYHWFPLKIKDSIPSDMNQAGSWGGTGATTACAGATVNCRPLLCPDCSTKATCVAANAAASCLTKSQITNQHFL